LWIGVGRDGDIVLLSADVDADGMGVNDREGRGGLAAVVRQSGLPKG
jgi:hypothetical protein